MDDRALLIASTDDYSCLSSIRMICTANRTLYDAVVRNSKYNVSLVEKADTKRLSDFVQKHEEDLRHIQPKKYSVTPQQTARMKPNMRVLYSRAGLGRLIARGPTTQNAMRISRSLCFGDTHVDLDMVNSCYTIISALFGCHASYLKHYVKHREEELVKMGRIWKLPRETVKDINTAIGFGASAAMLFEKYGKDSPMNAVSWSSASDLFNTMQWLFTTMVYSNRSTLNAMLCKIFKVKEGDRLTPSHFSCFIQHIESCIMVELIRHVTEDLHLHISTLIHDGIHVETASMTDEEVSRISAKVSERCGIPVVFKVKPFASADELLTDRLKDYEPPAKRPRTSVCVSELFV